MIITTDTPSALEQLAAQQEQLADAIEALTEQIADLTVASEQQDEQTRTIARAMRETAAEQAKTIAAIAKAGSNGNGDSGGAGSGGGTARSANKSPSDGDGKVVALKDGKTPKAGKSGLPQAIEAEQAVAAKVTGGAAEPPAEPPPAKRKAHRWI